MPRTLNPKPQLATNPNHNHTWPGPVRRVFMFWRVLIAHCHILQTNHQMMNQMMKRTKFLSLHCSRTRLDLFAAPCITALASQRVSSCFQTDQTPPQGPTIARTDLLRQCGSAADVHQASVADCATTARESTPRFNFPCCRQFSRYGRFEGHMCERHPNYLELLWSSADVSCLSPLGLPLKPVRNDPPADSVRPTQRFRPWVPGFRV